MKNQQFNLFITIILTIVALIDLWFLRYPQVFITAGLALGNLYYAWRHKR